MLNKTFSRLLSARYPTSLPIFLNLLVFKKTAFIRLEYSRTNYFAVVSGDDHSPVTDCVPGQRSSTDLASLLYVRRLSAGVERALPRMEKMLIPK